MQDIYTIGHSNRSWEQTLFFLQSHGITIVADVRRVPRSRWPQYNQAFLGKALAKAGIRYVHIERLGSLRDVAQDSPNTAWSKEPLLQGFADYMRAPEFKEGIDELLALREAHPDARIAFMCSEGKWEKCHRRLIADHLVMQGITVRHILSADPPLAHTLTAFAQIENGEIRYP